jgi:acyl-CoA thioesterase I
MASKRYAPLRLIGILAVVFGALIAAAQPGVAAVSEPCRVPDVYLALPELNRTEGLVDRKGAVKIAVIGPALAAAEGAAPLERELGRRLPAVSFSLSEERDVSGLAGEDFEDLRRIVDQAAPDLVVWQVGTADALAISDLGVFEAQLNAASAWVEARGIDLILVDPPFVPHVRHERIYNSFVGAMGDLSEEEDVPVLKRYAATQFWAIQKERRREAGSAGAHCTAEILAEAIFRAVTR